MDAAEMMNRLQEWYLRTAASGWISPRRFGPAVPEAAMRARRSGRLRIELVSHCWNYSHLLIYQLSSLILHPPRNADVVMSVYSAPEDERTRNLVEYFAMLDSPAVQFRLCLLPQESLFRRSIGRNQAALATRADWIWFTDCDVCFADGCLDGLCTAMQDSNAVLVYPRKEWVSALLDENSPTLNAGRCDPCVLPLDSSSFIPHGRGRATGPLQITHADVARACGYCRDIAYYQKPAPKWCKAHEDRAYRWLLGSQGEPIDIPGTVRIRHLQKGRYTGTRGHNHFRAWLRHAFQRRR